MSGLYGGGVLFFVGVGTSSMYMTLPAGSGCADTGGAASLGGDWFPPIISILCPFSYMSPATVPVLPPPSSLTHPNPGIHICGLLSMMALLPDLGLGEGWPEGLVVSMELTLLLFYFCWFYFCYKFYEVSVDIYR